MVPLLVLNASEVQPSLTFPEISSVWMLLWYNNVGWESSCSFLKECYLSQPSYCSKKGLYRIPYLLNSSYTMITCILVKLTPPLSKVYFSGYINKVTVITVSLRGWVPSVNSHIIDGTCSTKETRHLFAKYIPQFLGDSTSFTAKMYSGCSQTEITSAWQKQRCEKYSVLGQQAEWRCWHDDHHYQQISGNVTTLSLLSLPLLAR